MTTPTIDQPRGASLRRLVDRFLSIGAYAEEPEDQRARRRIMVQLIQTALYGGLLASGAVVLFELIIVFAALLALGVRTASWWFAGYVVSVVCAVLIPRWIDPLYTRPDPDMQAGITLRADQGPVRLRAAWPHPRQRQGRDGDLPARLAPQRRLRTIEGHPVLGRRPGTLVDEPVTIVSLASVQELGNRGDRKTLDATRFRMTFDLDGCEPYEEDTWSGRRVAIGRAELLVADPVGRCVITTLDQDTGQQDFPTLKVIAGYRELMPSGDAPFGLFAQVTRPGIVRVGDRVELRNR